MYKGKPNSSDEERDIGIKSNSTPVNYTPDLTVPRKLTGETVFKASRDYKSGWELEPFDCELKKVQAFDSSTNSRITEDDEDGLIRMEIEKFTQFIYQDKPPLFNSYGNFRNTDASGYTDLSNITHQIRINFEVIRHDNAGLAFAHYIRADFNEVFRSSRQTLRYYYKNEPKGAVERKSKVLDPGERNTQAYYALVDYILHSLAWWLTHVLDRDSWCAAMIAVLARWSVKLKLIALGPEQWASKSLSRGENIMLQANEKSNDVGKIKIKFPDSEGKDKETDTLEVTDLDYYYYSSKTHARKILYEMINVILGNLEAGIQRRKDYTAFEVHTILYRNDLDERLRQVTVERNGRVSTSSSATKLAYSHKALDLLISNVRAIRKSEVTDPEATDSEGATIECDIKDVKFRTLPEFHDFKIARLDEMISMLVPIGLMACAGNVQSLNNLSRRFSNNNDYTNHPQQKDMEKDGNNIRIEFSLTTHQRGFSRGRPLILSMKDVKEQIKKFGKDETKLKEKEKLQKQAITVFKEYMDRKEEVARWRWSEDSVLVYTKTFSYSTLAIAIAIIGGALSVPFVVGDGISGVDPFNFVSFSWVLAGAFLAGIKSRYNENWTWHSFLRGEIACHSVSELAGITGLSKQATLLCLLHQEFEKPLLFSGPCLGPFQRRSASGAKGFTIDCAVDHATMLAAGFIVYEACTDVINLDTDELNTFTVIYDTRRDQFGARRRKSFFSEPSGDNPSEEKQGEGIQREEKQLEIQLQLDKDPPAHTLVGVCTKTCTFV